MDHPPLWAGIDTSTRTFAICLVDNGGGIIREGIAPASIEAASAFLGDPSRIAEVAFETGATSLHPARMLEQAGYRVGVYPALGVQRYLRLSVNKTDANDARGLAEIARLRVGGVRKVFLRSRPHAILRMKLVTRERLTVMRKKNERALMSLLHSHGVRADARVTSQTALRAIVGRMVCDAEKTYGRSVRELVEPLVEISVFLRQHELDLENDLKRFARSDDLCRRLMAIPGIGVISAVSFITAVGDPDRFLRTTDIGPYLGLTPRVWETGAFSRKRGIPKRGGALTRRHLHLAARAMLRSNVETPQKTWAKALEQRTNRKKALVGLSRKLAILMLTMWKNGTSFEQVLLPPTSSRRGRLRTNT